MLRRDILHDKCCVRSHQEVSFKHLNHEHFDAHVDACRQLKTSFVYYIRNNAGRGRIERKSEHVIKKTYEFNVGLHVINVSLEQVVLIQIRTLQASLH